MRLLITVMMFSLVTEVSARDVQGTVPGKGWVRPQFGQPRQMTDEEKQAARDQAKARNKERQEKLKQDTDKLLQLATELKEYVDKTNENILSIEVIKKTDEIEKLAKSVREKMKTYEVPPGEERFPRR